MRDAFENLRTRDVHDRAGAPARVDPLAEVFAQAAVVELVGGAWLFRRGDLGQALYRVEQGCLDVVVEGEFGAEQVLARIGPGGILGEITYLLGGTRTAGVRARERSVVRALDRAVAGGIEPRIHAGLAALLAERLRSTNSLLQDLLDGDGGPGAGPGGEVTLRDDSPLPVLTRDQLQIADLRAVIEGEVLALRIPGWVSPRHCQSLCRRLLRHPGFSRYSIAPDVGVQRVGDSFFETRGEASALERYFELAVPTVHELRRICAPYLMPIDRLRLELDELWPAGAGLARILGRKTFVGTARLFEDGHRLPPHQDLLSRETDDPEAAALVAQLTANVYLRPPRRGGALAVWSLAPSDEEVQAFYTGEYDFIDEALLPPASARITPGQGELVLMQSNRIHAVDASQGGPRISVSCFIGVPPEGGRLSLWN